MAGLVHQHTGEDDSHYGHVAAAIGGTLMSGVLGPPDEQWQNEKA
jgi:hypothetical protein